ncbi:4331_t:CDS:2, partial [Ambispora gerdemannii]
AAERGHLRATLELANVYNRGFGTLRDKHKTLLAEILKAAILYVVNTSIPVI